MSTDKSDTIIEAGASDVVCASCGKAEIDDIKLKDCDKCDLARYCGDECQKNHLDDHEAICKERAAELREEILFRQPASSHLGDCPICFLPMPLTESKMNMQRCCCKLICFGCVVANGIRELEHGLELKCPFCRKLMAESEEEYKKNYEKRAEANDPLALQKLGDKHYIEGDYDSAFKYWTRAADLGDAMSHSNVSCLYRDGEGVEKDEGKEIYHLEEAAIVGNPFARHNLGLLEWKKNRFDRAVKHLIIAANLGYDNSLQVLKKLYKDNHGIVSKDDLAAAFRAHQAAVDATKSPQREAADKLVKIRGVL